MQFVPPLVYVGTPVQWFRTRSKQEKPWAAIVTANEGRTLSLWVISPGYNNGTPKPGCRHADDPDMTEIHERDVGCWREIPFDDECPQAVEINEKATGRAFEKANAVAGSFGPGGKANPAPKPSRIPQPPSSPPAPPPAI